MERPVCLIATHLSLLNLAQKKYGIYRRLSMLAEAAAATGAALRIFCVAYPSEHCEGIEQRISAEIREHWHLDAEVIVGRTSAPSKAPWLVRQIIGTLGYGRSTLVRDLLDGPSREALAREIRNPAFVIAHRLPMMHFVRRLTRSPIIFDLDDLEHVAIARGMKQLKGFRAKLFAALSIPGLLWAELRAVRKARQTLVCSSIDAQRARSLFLTPNVIDVPNAAPILAETPATSAWPVLLMVGIYDFEPNKDAADYFVSAVLPLIHKAKPHVEVWFVGGSPEALQHHGANVPGVRHLGFVDDLAAVYREARVVICPIRYGSGTRVKLIEAAAWGKPIVTTTIGAEGLDMMDGLHALFADDPEAFASQCLQLLDSTVRCDTLGRNARALAQSVYDRKQIVRSLTQRFFAHMTSATISKKHTIQNATTG